MAAAKRKRATPTRKRLTAIEEKIITAGLNTLKPSELLTIAVNDAIAAKRAGWKMMMGLWTDDRRCACCMAGACMVMRGTEDRGWTAMQQPYAVRIDDLRKGHEPTGARVEFTNSVQNARMSEVLGLIRSDFQRDRDGGRAKWATYRKAAKMLAEVGL